MALHGLDVSRSRGSESVEGTESGGGRVKVPKSVIPRISVLCDVGGTHVLQLFAGLTALRRNGQIQLDYRLPPSPETRRLHGGSLWFQADFAGRLVKVCIDLFDGGAFASPDGLEKADVYFKRSYDSRVVQTLDPSTRQKVKRLGLNLFCLGDTDKDIAVRTAIERRHRRNAGKPLTSDEWRFRATLLVSSWSPSWLPRTVGRHLIPRESAFRARAGVRRHERVVFQPRVYPPEMAPTAPDILDVNEQRASLVRALRRRFGHRFIGGVCRSRFADQRYADCLTPLPDDQWTYIRMLRTCSVAVVTDGIHGSIPWKVPEFLATGLCIVAEPLKYELPSPLLPGEHLLEYSTEEACLEACDRLLSNPQLRGSMEGANLAYFDTHVRAERLMARCIAIASESAS